MIDNEDQILAYFKKTRERFEDLDKVEISLVFSNLYLFFTMISVVNSKSLFKNKRKYRIIVNRNQREVLTKLSEQGYIGWFAHELSHIVEYEKMTKVELLSFAFKYILFKEYRFEVEKRVTTIAIEKGFVLELCSAWRSFMALKKTSSAYKNYIKKNYLPNWDHIKADALASGISKLEYDEIIHVERKELN